MLDLPESILTVRRAPRWNLEVTLGPLSCLITWGHGDKLHNRAAESNFGEDPSTHTLHYVPCQSFIYMMRLQEEKQSLVLGLLWAERREKSCHHHHCLSPDTSISFCWRTWGGRKSAGRDNTPKIVKKKKKLSFLSVQVKLLTEQPGSLAACSGTTHPPHSPAALLSYPAEFYFPSVPYVFIFFFFL